MKKLFTVLLIVFVVSAQAQTTPEVKQVAPEILVLKQLTHDFGKIQQGRPVTTNFEVTNVGKVVDGRSACVHTNRHAVNGRERFSCSCKGIRQLEHRA